MRKDIFNRDYANTVLNRQFPVVCFAVNAEILTALARKVKMRFQGIVIEKQAVVSYVRRRSTKMRTAERYPA
jgi:hypothetical protein